MRVIPSRLGKTKARVIPLPSSVREEPLPVVASLNLSPAFGEVEANLRLAESRIREVKESHPALRWIVLPELFTSGYSDLASVHRYAECATNGLSVRWMSDLAHELDVYIAYGFPEALPSCGVATSANLIGPGVLATYRKRHLVRTTLESAVFTPGSEVPVVEAGGLRVAMLVCWDLSHPLTVREAAMKGADLILAPAAWRDPWSAQFHLTCAARALDNGIYVASANQTGTYPEASFSASGGLYAPDGNLVSTSDGEISTGELDPESPSTWRVRFGDMLADSELYEELSGETSSGIA